MVVCFSCIWAGSNWFGWFGRPGGDRLSRTLRCSIIGAGVFHGRVRDGIGWIIPRHGHQVVRAIRLWTSVCVGWCVVRVGSVCCCVGCLPVWMTAVRVYGVCVLSLLGD